MNNLKTITNYTFKEQLFPFSPKKIISKYPKNYVGRLALFAFSYIFLGLFFFYFASASATVYINGQNNEAMYFAMFGVILTLLLLTMYIPQMLSSFFKSSEINIMKTWPVSEGELYMGKFFGVVLGNFDFILFFLVYLILYFVGVGFSVSQLVLGIINFICLIIIPYGIILGLILLLLKFTNIGSHKKLIKNLGYVLLFIFIGVIYYFSFSSGEDYGANQSEGFGKAVEAIGGISDVFFHAKIFGLAMTGPITQQLTYTLILVAIAALICFILYRLSDKYFYDAVSESGTSTKKRVEKSPSEVDFTRKSQPVAIMKRDMKNLFSNIVFFAQAITFVVIFGVMALTLGRQFANELSTDTVMDGVFKFWVFMAGFLLSAMIWTSTGFGQTALSREQKSFYLFQTLPIDPINHYSGRFMSAFLSTEIFNLALAIVFTIFIKLGIVNGILVFLGLSLGALFATPLSLWIGSNGININWKKPEEVTKGGMKFFITYILSMIFIGLVIAAYVLIINITGSHNIASFVILVVILALTVLASTLAIKVYKKGFYDI